MKRHQWLGQCQNLKHTCNMISGGWVKTCTETNVKNIPHLIKKKKTHKFTDPKNSINSLRNKHTENNIRAYHNEMVKTSNKKRNVKNRGDNIYDV